MAAKALCIAGMVIAGLVASFFLLDLILAFVYPPLAPFQGAHLIMDFVFVGLAVALGFLSWVTWKDQI